MPRTKTPLQHASGLLISAIQKEWICYAGEGAKQEEAFAVMDRAHVILQAGKLEDVRSLLNGRTVADYLGAEWVKRHPTVVTHIYSLEKLLAEK
jgi:hypothetical protein